MNRSKKIFYAFTLIFIILMAILTYDMSKKTIKPWERKKNNILDKYKIKT
jgi:hypothetical protein